MTALIYRPKPSHPRRRIWNPVRGVRRHPNATQMCRRLCPPRTQIHWTIGGSAAILAIANIYYGLTAVELTTWAWISYTCERWRAPPRVLRSAVHCMPWRAALVH